MEFSHGGENGSGEEEASSSKKGKKQYHRHSTQQIQQLEVFYKEHQHPDKSQRMQLSKELGLDQKQIKFWFQNKRTQIKAQNEKANNSALRTENDRIRYENLAMHEALRNIICPNCNGLGLKEEEKHLNLEQLRMENEQLKEQVMAMKYFSNHMGNSEVMPLPALEHLTTIPANAFLGGGMGTNSLDHNQASFSSENPATPQYWSSGILDGVKSSIMETAINAMDELVELMRINEPVWIKSPSDGRYLLHRDSYDKLFPKPNHFKSSSARFESSKDSGEVAMGAIHLVEIFLDVSKWKDTFPHIVTKARTIEVIDTGVFGGLLHLMYEKMHIMSPLVAPREFFFIRYCRQVNSTTWFMVDVSYNFYKELQDTSPMRSWKFPSGCMIEDLSSGTSRITWIEHVQVDDKTLTHRLYRDLVFACQAYGAKRWITSLQRMCERLSFSMGLAKSTSHELEGVINSLEGRRNLMKLSHKMIKDFCEALSMPDKLDFPHQSEFRNSGIRVSLRKGSGVGQPGGFIVSAASSVWLPISSEDLFDFFNDEKKRVQWDVLSSGNPINAVAHISTGTDASNCISIMQPFLPKENSMLMLQESSIDALGALIVYAPIDLTAIISVVNGEDMMKVPILPSGYVISSNAHTDKGSGGASSSSSNAQSNGSILTVAFQILVCHTTLTKQLNMECVATVHSMISSTIQKIKTALNCSD